MRSLSQKLPIFALTTSTNDDHAAQLLEQGADYLVHIPCDAKEIRAQLNNFLRLTLAVQKENTSNILHIGELKIFLKNNQVMLGEEYLALTVKEYKLLLALAHNLNKIVDTESLYEAVYPQSEVKLTSRSLNMHLSNLRHKLHLEDYTNLSLETKRGKGVGLFYITDPAGGENQA